MSITNLKRRNDAPDNLSTKDINKFKSELATIVEKMKEGNNTTFNDEATMTKQIVIADEGMLCDYLKAHQYNTDYKTVIQKVRLIDFLYSTNLRMSGSGIFSDIANIILGIPDFDERVKNGCVDLINDMANGIKGITGKNHFSFVTKYCCNHNFHIYDKDDYSIYDTAMNKAIPDYLNVTYTYIYNKCRGEMNYKLYHTIINSMIKEYRIKTEKTRRDIDLYLWYLYR